MGTIEAADGNFMPQPLVENEFAGENKICDLQRSLRDAAKSQIKS